MQVWSLSPCSRSQLRIPNHGDTLSLFTETPQIRSDKSWEGIQGTRVQSPGTELQSTFQIKRSIMDNFRGYQARPGTVSTHKCFFFIHLMCLQLQEDSGKVNLKERDFKNASHGNFLLWGNPRGLSRRDFPKKLVKIC